MEQKSRSFRLQRGDPYLGSTFGGSKSFRLPRSGSFIGKIVGGSRSFRLPRSGSYISKITGGSKSSRLVLESVPYEYATRISYERFESDESPRHQKAGIRRFLCQVFTRNVGDEGKVNSKATTVCSIEGKVKETKRRSSWLPDPDRRWPVQGW